MPRLALAIPCYDEADRLDTGAFRAFLEEHPEVDLVFADDGSRDGTRALLTGLAQRFPERASVLAWERNRGKAEAVRQGVLRALERDYEFVGYWDADLATPLPVALAFCDLLDRRPELEIVMGSRVQLLGRRIEGSKLRHYLGRICASVAAEMLGLPVDDTQCGAKVFRVTPTLKDLFAEPFRTGWIFDVEILARLMAQRQRAGLRPPREVLYEQPLDCWVDVAGSKIGPRAYLRSAIDAVRLWRAYPLGPRARRPR